MNILGISAFYHDSAACLVSSGKIVSAAQEERFTRVKHDCSFPTNTIKFCLNNSNLRLSDIDYIVFYDKPFRKFERIFETYLAFAPRGFTSFRLSAPEWLHNKLFQKKLLLDNLHQIDDVEDLSDRLLFSEHHLSHAASAFFPSPFESSGIICLDGVGEWSTTSTYFGSNNNISPINTINFPHSLGLLYSAVTYYLGFKVNSGEYKVMGLAPYGRPLYTQLILDNLIDLKDDGSFCLNMEYFNYCAGLTMTNNKFHELFGGNPRSAESQLTQREMDIAASIQNVIEIAVEKIARNTKKITSSKYLCLAGGVALNCVSNGKILKSRLFEEIWVQPASGDAGGAIGAALAVYYMMLDNNRVLAKHADSMSGSYLGPKFSQGEIEQSLTTAGAVFKTLTYEELIKEAAVALSSGLAMGWFQGRMEFGPRSLGGRSILADPRVGDMQKKLNLKVKFRESFRPFAPSVLRSEVGKWFDEKIESPYMLIVTNIKEDKLINPENINDSSVFGIDRLNQIRSVIPSVTHVDNSARIQTVDGVSNREYFDLLTEFFRLTGCPVLINTSFNVRGEPIVNTPQDAFRCFMGTGLDILVVGNSIMYKQDQDIALAETYLDKFEND